MSKHTEYRATPDGGWEKVTIELVDPQSPEARLEHLRAALRAENISMGELIELQSLADHIQPGDVELAEPAGIPEQEFMQRGQA